MNVDRNEWICKRAYALWEQSGRLDGLHDENWCMAVAEFEMMDKTRASPDGAEVLRFRARTIVARRTSSAKQMVA